MFSKAARPAAPCATYCYHAFGVWYRPIHRCSSKNISRISFGIGSGKEITWVGHPSSGRSTDNIRSPSKVVRDESGVYRVQLENEKTNSTTCAVEWLFPSSSEFQLLESFRACSIYLSNRSSVVTRPAFVSYRLTLNWVSPTWEPFRTRVVVDSPTPNWLLT